MGFTNKTQYYNLPQYLADDKPAWLTDINSAFLTIDTELHNLSGSTSIETVENRLTTLETTTTAQGTKIDTNANNITANTTNISTNTTDISDLKTRVSTLETNVGNIEVELAKLNNGAGV